jgi:hypothetical protein
MSSESQETTPIDSVENEVSTVEAPETTGYSEKVSPYESVEEPQEFQDPTSEPPENINTDGLMITQAREEVNETQSVDVKEEAPVIDSANISKEAEGEVQSAPLIVAEVVSTPRPKGAPHYKKYIFTSYYLT